MMNIFKGKNEHASENLEFSAALTRFSTMIHSEEFTGFDLVQISITKSFIHELIHKSKSHEFDDIERLAFDNLAKEVSKWIKTIVPKEFNNRVIEDDN